MKPNSVKWPGSARVNTICYHSDYQDRNNTSFKCPKPTSLFTLKLLFIGLEPIPHWGSPLSTSSRKSESSSKRKHSTQLLQKLSSLGSSWLKLVSKSTWLQAVATDGELKVMENNKKWSKSQLPVSHWPSSLRPSPTAPVVTTIRSCFWNKWVQLSQEWRKLEPGANKNSRKAM